MKLLNVFFLLTAFLLISRCEAKISEERIRERQDIVNKQSRQSLGEGRVVDFGPGSDALLARTFAGRRRRCDANVCFAIDGNRQLSLKDFKLQLKFVELVTALSGKRGPRFTGVQYGLRNVPIKRNLVYRRAFIQALKRTRWQRSSRAFMTGGLAGCSQQLRRSRNRGKIVLLADGRGSPFGLLSGPLGPAGVAASFRRRSRGNAVIAVAVGYRNTQLFNKIVGGNRSLVHTVGRWDRVRQIVRAVIQDIC